MKFIFLTIVLCTTISVAWGLKLLASSSRQLNRRETKLVKRLVKRQALNDPNCDRRACNVPNCGKDFVAAALPGECCEKCVPWEYAASLGIQYPQAPPPPAPVYDPRLKQGYTYDQYSYNQPQRVDVYIFGPEDGARVSTGQSIYFDCEVISPYNQYAQPRWTRSGNQPLPYKVQSTTLPGNRKLARLTIPDATHSDAGRYECNGGTGNPNDQASIDLQVTEGGYYPRPQPQPQPQYPSYDPYNQYPYNQPSYYPPRPQPPPPPQPQPQPPPQPQPQPPAADEGEDDGIDDEDAAGEDEGPEAASGTTTTAKTTAAPAPDTPDDDQNNPADEGEYPEDYTENEK